MLIEVAIAALSGEELDVSKEEYPSLHAAIVHILYKLPKSRYMKNPLTGKRERVSSPPWTLTLHIDGCERRIDYYDTDGNQKTLDCVMDELAV